MVRAMNESHPTIGLRDGDPIPVVGLGVYQTPPGEVTQRAVFDALACGYRHVDTASAYDNEKDVGVGLKKSELPRQDVFVTTMVWNSDQGYDKTLKACEVSLKRLGLDYVDLYLMHWPVARLRKDTWRAMTTLKKSGKARAIGVSNFMVKHLEELLDADVVPEVNQIELHPFLYPVAVTDLCAKHGIVVEAYSPLTRGARIDDPAIAKVANKLRRTSAQVLVRWGIQHGWVSLPKSTRKARIEENANVFDFEIPGEDMRDLDQLNEDLHTSWDPTDAP
jgi:diketogulonate reductase-like aldo/keto reductase